MAEAIRNSIAARAPPPSDTLAGLSAAFFGIGGLFAGMSKTTPYLQVFGLFYCASTLTAIKQIRGNVGEFQDENRADGFFRAAGIALVASPALVIEYKRNSSSPLSARAFPALALLVNTTSLMYHSFWWQQLRGDS